MAERRKDPTVVGGKKTYTKAQFMDFYGGAGKGMWKKAGKALAAAEQTGADRRRDPTTPSSKKTYTKKQFVEFYGANQGGKMWKQAGAPAPGKKASGKKAPAKAAPPAQKKLPKVHLKYWDGRGLMEVPRMMLALRGKTAGTDFTDGRYTTEAEMYNSTVQPMDSVTDTLGSNLGRMPTCDVGKASVGQSAAINYYLATELGLMGKSSLEGARIIAIQEHIKEMMTAKNLVLPSSSVPTEELLTKWFTTGATDKTGKADGAKRAERYLLWFLGRIEQVVGDDGFAVGRRISYADLMLYNALAENLKEADRAGRAKDAPHICEPMGSQAKMDEALKEVPKIAKIIVNVAGNKKIQAYLAKRGEQRF